MLETVKRITVGAIVLSLIPLMVLISAWHWQPGGNEKLIKVLYWITETVSMPWGILTSIFLSIWFVCCLRLRSRAALGFFVLLSATILSGQGIKSMLKNAVQEPRPFVNWLDSSHHIDEKYFYSLPRKERSLLLEGQLQDQTLIPEWLSNHWQRETGFAFPSGHTMFAASWALLGLLLWPSRHYKTVVVLMIWANCVRV